MKKVVIVGGGVIGLFTAYYLSEEGFEVVILDKGDLKNNCSLGNAGMIVPSHIVPLASPGIIGKGLKWMLSAKSPFYIHPMLNRKLLQWCLLFYRSATKEHVEMSIPYLKNLSLYSKNLYLTLREEHKDVDLGMEEKGLLMLYKTSEGQHEEEEFARLALKNGIETEILTKEDVQKMEPNVALDILGGVYFPGDAHLDPYKLNKFLLKRLEIKGVKIIRSSTVLDFAYEGRKVKSVITDNRDYNTDYLIIAAGSQSGTLAEKLRVRMPMLGGKGYSFMATNSPKIELPAILTEARVAVTPFESQVRFGGTMEITNNSKKINMNRVRGIYEAVSEYYKDFQFNFPEEKEVWTGMRPCSPDGLPYIGFTGKWNNVLFGTGHSMMGISLAPATGRLLTNKLMHERLRVQLDAFSPDRFN